MNTMLIEGFKVVRSSDVSYEVRDSCRVLGHVVRFEVPVVGSVLKKFRAFGQDFATLRCAVEEFKKISNIRPFDAKGDREAT